MSLPVVTFVTVLAGSFALLFGTISAAPVSKSTKRRVGAIQDAARGPEISGFQMKVRQQRRYATYLNRMLERLRIMEQLDAFLIQADSRMGAGGCILAGIAVTVAPPVVVFLFGGSVFEAAPAAPAGVAALSGWLHMQRQRRVRNFNTVLPDAIDLLARALRAGHSVASALEMVGEQSPEPLGVEFTQVFQQQRLGLPFRDALMQMSERMPSRDLYFLITAILIQKETGGDLTEILDRTAHVIRERVRIEGEVRTRTAQGRLTGWILALLPVAMLAIINLVNPGYSDVLFHDPQGRYWLYLGAGLIVVGGLIIRKIVDVKV
jgi:tight adherence protein B